MKNLTRESPEKLTERIGAYVTDDSWQAIAAKAAIVVYMFVPAYFLMKTCNPWWVYFEYLTVWGWTAIHFYFAFCLLLDIRGKVIQGRNYSRRKEALRKEALRKDGSSAGGRKEGSLEGSLEGSWEMGRVSSEVRRDIIAEAEISVVARVVAQGLSELCFAVSVVITGLFWFVIYPQERWRNVWFELQMHGVGLTLMIVDYLYRCTGFHMRNHGYVVGFGLIYTCLHIFLVKLHGKPIYPGLDFNGPYSISISIIGIATMVTTHKLIYLTYHWARVKRNVKSAIGITQFLLIPRMDSKHLLTYDEVLTENNNQNNNNHNNNDNNHNNNDDDYLQQIMRASGAPTQPQHHQHHQHHQPLHPAHAHLLAGPETETTHRR